jgi:hypothetical protein
MEVFNLKSYLDRHHDNFPSGVYSVDGIEVFIAKGQRELLIEDSYGRGTHLRVTTNGLEYIRKGRYMDIVNHLTAGKRIYFVKQEFLPYEHDLLTVPNEYMIEMFRTKRDFNMKIRVVERDFFFRKSKNKFIIEDKHGNGLQAVITKGNRSGSLLYTHLKSGNVYPLLSSEHFEPKFLQALLVMYVNPKLEGRSFPEHKM